MKTLGVIRVIADSAIYSRSGCIVLKPPLDAHGALSYAVALLVDYLMIFQFSTNHYTVSAFAVV